MVSWLTAGEGRHNYHHAIPCDYKAAELGPSDINWTTYHIELFSRIGWAYDLKTTSSEMIHRLVEKRRDGDYYKWGDVGKGTEGAVGQGDGDNFELWEMQEETLIQHE